MRPLRVDWNRFAGVELTRINPWELDSSIPKSIRKEAEKQFPKNLYPEDFKWRRDEYCSNWLSEKSDEAYDHIDTEGHRFHQENQDTVLRWGSDPYCYEVPSVKLDGWERLEKFFTKTDAFCETLGLLRHSDEVSGTGGHIHLSINGSQEAGQLKKVALNHPEMHMAFCHPCDDYNRLDNLYKREARQDHWRSMYKNEHAPDLRQGPICYRSYYGTVEFRMFDVAQTLEMQEEHMAFAQAFLKHATSIATPEKLLFREEVEARSVNEHIEQFAKLIHKLGLPWHRYQDYAHNIKMRLQWKTQNFFPLYS